MAAEFRVLFTGYVGEHTASTVSFVRDDNVRVIIDPGMVPDPPAILGTVAFTHLWWSASGPAEDPYATDPSAVHRNCARVLGDGEAHRPGSRGPVQTLH